MLYYLNLKKVSFKKHLNWLILKKKSQFFVFDKNPGINNKTKIG
jgi:hypothetical protein